MLRCLMLLLVCLSLPVSAGEYPAGTAGKVDITLDSWHDPARDRDIPVKIYRPEGPGPFPVVLFSHGLGGSREGGRLWGAYWAAHGLLAIHMQHPGSDKAVWENVAGSRLAALKGAANARQLKARTEDVRFVLDELTRRQVRGDALASAADLRHIGMSGHSFGAVTTQAVAGEHFPLIGTRLSEPRITAFWAFSPSARRDPTESFGDIQRPFFSATGTEDADQLGTGLVPTDRQKPYGGMPAGDKYLLVLEGRNHMFFSGDHLAATDTVEARQQALLMQASLAFWRMTLLGDKPSRAWLNDMAGQEAAAARATLQNK
ncbi:alpha/beta hydrolase family protein [Chitinimonas naiadis]